MASLDYITEIEEIKQGLKEAAKEIVLTIDVATVTSLTNTILKKPRVLHITCHGEYSKRLGEYYLAFEDKHDLGVVDRVDSQRLKTLIGDCKNVQLVMVNACHS